MPFPTLPPHGASRFAAWWAAIATPPGQATKHAYKTIARTGGWLLLGGTKTRADQVVARANPALSAWCLAAPIDGPGLAMLQQHQG